MHTEWPVRSEEYVQSNVDAFIADTYCDACLAPASEWATPDRYGNLTVATIERCVNGDLEGFLCPKCAGKRPVFSFQTAIALATYAYDYHGGMGTRLYRLGCLAQRYLQRHYGFDGDLWRDVTLGERAHTLERHLVWGNKR